MRAGGREGEHEKESWREKEENKREEEESRR
jgi:hypothetical protein